MKKLIAVVLSAVLLVTAAVAYADTTRVRVGDDFFRPSLVRIDRGDIVRWSWTRTRNRHNVRGPGVSTPIARSGSAARRFRRRGDFRYICDVHPRSMRMTVRVR